RREIRGDVSVGEVKGFSACERCRFRKSFSRENAGRIEIRHGERSFSVGNHGPVEMAAASARVRRVGEMEDVADASAGFRKEDGFVFRHDRTAEYPDGAEIVLGGSVYRGDARCG